MEEIHKYFTGLDWAVLFGYLLLTTWVGHAMRGKQANIKDFFAGGRSLPWPAVSGSIIATEISGVTFIGVPGGVMAAQGDFTYLVWGFGSIIGRNSFQRPRDEAIAMLNQLIDIYKGKA